MADDIDRAQEREQIDRDLCVRKLTERRRWPRAICECGKHISSVRQELGARFCVECQQGIEAEAKRRTVRGCL